MIKEISMMNFRGHTKNYLFGPGKNQLRGRNEAGKSTIKEAIAFAWMGTDSAGSKSPDHLITVGTDVTEVSLATPKSVISRRKRKGSTGELKLTISGVPPVKLSQTDLQVKLKLSHELFMSCWNVGYFMALKSDAKLKVLSEIARLDRRSLLLSLLPDNAPIPAQVKLANPRIDADVVAGLRRQEQNKRASTEGMKAGLQIQGLPPELQALDVKGSAVKLANLEERIAEFEMYDKLLNKFRLDSERVKSAGAAKQRLLETQSESQRNLEQLNFKINELTAAIKVDSDKASELSSQITAKSQTIKKVEMAVPSKSSVTVGECPTCHQVVSPEYVKKIEEVYAAQLRKYNTHESDVFTFNGKVLDEIASLNKHLSGYKEAVASKTADLNSLLGQKKTVVASLEKAVAELSRLNEAVDTREPVMPTPPPGDVAALKIERDQLKTSIHTYNVFVSQNEKNKAEIEKIDERLVQADRYISSLALVEEALRKLPEIETQKTLEVVRVPTVKLTLQEGELLVTDEKGVDYRCLSDGRKIKVDLALAAAIQAAAGPTAPRWLFVDNADLVDEEIPVPTGTQLLLAIVDPSVEGMEVVQM